MKTHQKSRNSGRRRRYRLKVNNYDEFDSELEMKSDYNMSDHGNGVESDGILETKSINSFDGLDNETKAKIAKEMDEQDKEIKRQDKWRKVKNKDKVRSRSQKTKENLLRNNNNVPLKPKVNRNKNKKLKSKISNSDKFKSTQTSKTSKATRNSTKNK